MCIRDRFTSTSAVCVTGLVVVDTADSFTAIGQAIVAALIQIGGLGIASVGVGFIIAAGKRAVSYTHLRGRMQMLLQNLWNRRCKICIRLPVLFYRGMKM